MTLDNFPLTVMGTLVYGRTMSSPVITAQTPEIANWVATALNDYAAIKQKVESDGGVTVLPPGHATNW